MKIKCFKVQDRDRVHWPCGWVLNISTKKFWFHSQWNFHYKWIIPSRTWGIFRLNKPHHGLEWNLRRTAGILIRT